MQSTGTPNAEMKIDEPLVRALVDAQHPDLASLPVQRFGEGWDNALFRLGDHLLVRLPRRQLSAQLLRHEQQWLHKLAATLTVRVPVPLRCGLPSDRYPWCWSIVPLLPGRTANEEPLHATEARTLASFLRSLHVPAPDDAPCNPVRGVPLREREIAVGERIARVQATGACSARVTAIWERALETNSAEAPTWAHGDLHERNVLTHEGRMAAVIDWGDLCGGDRATDLAAVWTLLDDARAREVAMAAYDRDDDALWARARGWAVMFGVTLLDTGLVDNPVHARMGAQVLRRLDEGP